MRQDLFIAMAKNSARNGDVKTMKWLYKSYGKQILSHYLMVDATGSLEMIQYLHSIKATCSYYVMDTAAKRKNLNVLKWVYETIWKPKNEIGCTKDAMNKAYNIEIIKWLYENIWRKTEKPSAEIFTWAAKKNNIEFAKYVYYVMLREEFSGNYYFVKEALLHVCSHNNIEFVKWIFSLPIYCCDQNHKHDISPITRAVREGHIELVKYLIEDIWKNNLQIQDIRDIFDLAIYRSHFDILKWLYDKFKNTLQMRIPRSIYPQEENGLYETTKWLFDNAFKSWEECHEIAEKGRSIKTLYWLKSIIPPK